MINTFILEKTTPIYLYGINRYSEALADELERNGFCFLGYIDKRATDLNNTYKKTRVVDLSSFVPSRDDFVIITLQNAIIHEEVAGNLASKGINRILFLPMQEFYDEKIRGMCGIYNRIVYLHDYSSVEIPYYDSLLLNKTETREITIDEKWKIVYVPFDIIYTTFEENEFADIPILDFTPYRQLFNYLKGKPSDISIYLDRYGVNSCKYSNDYSDSYILRQRQELYKIWEIHYCFKDGYFEAAAPLAEWNENGYFNLLEGQHRVLYQILKGEAFLPICMSNNTYNKSILYVKKYTRSKTMIEWENHLAESIL